MPRLLPLAVVLVTLLSGCGAHHSRLVLPPCTQELSVTGEHSRTGRRELTFDHTWDLAGATTVVELEGEGGVQRVEIPSSLPDMPRLVTGLVFGGVSVVLLARYAYVVSGGEDVTLGEGAWALPLALGGLTLAGGMALTGWHPPGDTVLEGVCHATEP